MDVTFYAYYFDAKKIRGKKIEEVDNYEEDFVHVIEQLAKNAKRKRKEDFLDCKKIVYLNDYDYNSQEHILLLEFVSAKYAYVRKVVDTDTLKERPEKKKEKKDGDEETTCIAIKFSENTSNKEAKALIQSNSNGISISKIAEYLNMKIDNYHKNIKKDMIRYKVEYTNIISDDFLEALRKAQHISAVTLTVDQEDLSVSDYKDLAGKKDIRSDVEIVMKPARGKTITRNTVQEFFNLYDRADRKIRKISVAARYGDGSPLSFDTEKMKAKEHALIAETVTGEANIDDLKNELRSRVKLY